MAIFRLNRSTVVTIRGLKATEEGKPAAVKVSFKVRKTGKTSKYSYASKVNVIEDKQANAIVSATQTGVKEVTVTTNFDATNSTISLTKGSAAVEEKHGISADGKTITFNTTASIVAATYTVKVDDLTKDFEGEASKTTKIVFLSDKAALRKLGTDAAIYKGASVGYRVENQFGDDITKNVSLTATASCDVQLSPSNNMIYFSTDSQNGFMLGRDMITVSLLDTTTGLSETATLTVSAEAYASDITFEGVYNVDNKELTEDTNFTNDSFYALFTAKDQYGNKFLNYKGITEGKQLFLTVIGGLTGLDKQKGANFIVIQKDGTDYLAFPLAWSGSITPSAGTANIQVLSSGGGTCNAEIVIGQGGRVDTFSATQNDVIVAGEENVISYTALDASGNPVTSYKLLKDITITGGADGYSLDFVRQDDGSAKLVLNAKKSGTVSKNNPVMLSYAFKTVNNKFSNTLLRVSENARPVAINGLRDVDTTISNKLTGVNVKVKNLVIEDQYGRVLPDWQVAGMMNATSAGIRYLKDITLTLADTSVIKVATSGAVSSAGIVTNGGLCVSPGAATVNKDTTLFTISPASDTATGTKALTLQIRNGADKKEEMLADATVDVNFVVRNTTASTAAKAEVGSVYVVTGATVNASRAGAYCQDVKVKVGSTLLSKDDYTVSVPAGMAVTESAINDAYKTTVYAVYSTLGQEEIKEFKDKTATTVTRTITITLNGSGEKFTQDVTLDSTAPKITTVGDLKSSISPVSGCVISGQALFATPGGVTADQKLVILSHGWIGDQYGKTVRDNEDGTFTLTDGTVVTPSYNFVCTVPFGSAEVGAPLNLINNNKSDAAMKVGTGFKGATLYIDFGGKTATVIIDSVSQ